VTPLLERVVGAEAAKKELAELLAKAAEEAKKEEAAKVGFMAVVHMAIYMAIYMVTYMVTTRSGASAGYASGLGMRGSAPEPGAGGARAQAGCGAAGPLARRGRACSSV
jgi:hypothetical protein